MKLSTFAEAKHRIVIHSLKTRSITGFQGVAKNFLCFLHKIQLVTVYRGTQAVPQISSQNFSTEKRLS